MPLESRTVCPSNVSKFWVGIHLTAGALEEEPRFLFEAAPSSAIGSVERQCT
jgi:hypothetical protein